MITAFLESLPAGQREAFATAEVEAWLATSLRAAREAFPTIAIEDDEVAHYLGEKVGALSDPIAGYTKLRVSDLFLALACLARMPAAIRVFEDLHFTMLDRTLARAKATSPDDVKSLMREQLFFGLNDAPPLIGSYSGRGDLASWLRSIALRLATKTRRKDGRHVELESGLVNIPSPGNPEIEYLRQAHAAAFEAALSSALQSLEVRERNLLRQHHLDGLNVDALGQMYGVHRATAARWLVDARERVLDAVKRELASKMSVSELESFLRATRGELGLRLSKILRVN